MSAAMEIIYCLLSNKMKSIRELFPAISLQSLFFLKKKSKRISTAIGAGI
jgi:5'(3')-deoxyribonucleotidase